MSSEYGTRQRILTGGLFLLLRQVVSMPVNWLGVILVSRLLLPEDFGAQAVFLPVVTISFLLIDLGTSIALVQLYKIPSSILLRKVKSLKLFGGFLSVAILFIVARPLANFFSLSETLVLCFPVAGIVGLLQSQRFYFAACHQRQLNWAFLTWVEMFEIIIYNVVLVGFAWATHSAWSFVIGLAVRYFFGAILLKMSKCTISLPETQSNTSQTAKHLAPLLRFGLPIQATTFMGILNNFANPIIVGNVVNLGAVGIVNWSNQISSLPRVPLQPLSIFLFSGIAERRRQEKDDKILLQGLTFAGTVFIGLITGLSLMVLEWGVEFFFGDQWLKATLILRLMLILNIVMFPDTLLSSQLNANGYSKDTFLLNALRTVLWWWWAGLGAYLVGTVGFVVGWGVAVSITFILLCLTFQRRVGANTAWFDSFYVMLAVVLSNWLVRSFGVFLNNPIFVKVIVGGLLQSLILLPLVFRRMTPLITLFSVLFPALKRSQGTT